MEVCGTLVMWRNSQNWADHFKRAFGLLYFGLPIGPLHSVAFVQMKVTFPHK